MVKVKLDLNFLYWYLSFTSEYFRTHILLPIDASSCYTFSSQEKVSQLAGKKLPKRLKRQREPFKSLFPSPIMMML